VTDEKHPPKKTVWVLDTETKGTGAEMVPLDSRKAVEGHGAIVVQPRQKREKPPEPKLPRKFKVVDVMTGRALAEGADARTTVRLLEGIRSPVDVSIQVWEEKAGRWQQLSRRESQMLWSMRGRASGASSPAPAGD
jgi:hypothetical protein